MGDIKYAITKKYEFKIWNGKKTSTILVELIDYQNTDARIKLTNFLAKIISTKLQLPLETSMEIKQGVVTEENEFQHRGKSKTKKF